MGRSILYAALFVTIVVAAFVLGAPLLAKAGLAKAAEPAFPIALLLAAVAGFLVGRPHKPSSD